MLLATQAIVFLSDSQFPKKWGSVDRFIVKG